MTCGICAKELLILFHEMTNVFNMFDFLLTNINYTAIQRQKPKGHGTWLVLLKSQDISDCIKSKSRSSRSGSQLTILSFMKCFFRICPAWTSKYLSKLLFFSPNFASNITRVQGKNWSIKHLSSTYLFYW